MTKTTLTANETRMLRQIRDSEYHDGSSPIDRPVWRFAAMDGFPGKTGNGVLSSLSKKGLAKSQEDGKDDEGRDESVVWITQKGFDALAAHESSAPKITKRAAAKKSSATKTKKPARAAKPAKTEQPTTTTQKPRDPAIPPAGTTLTKSYTPRGGKTREIKVLVRETDFEFEGESYKSLSAIATKLADGTPKNGLLWFGLRKRELPKVDPAAVDADAQNHAREQRKEQQEDRAAKRSRRHKTTRRAGRDPEVAAPVDEPTPDAVDAPATE